MAEQTSEGTKRKWVCLRLMELAAVAVAVCFILPHRFFHVRRKGPHMALAAGPVRLLEPGVLFQEIDLPGGDGTRTLWIYTPVNARKPMPCLLMAPAGSPCFVGKALEGGDRDVHLPFVRKGYIVVAYSVDGAVPDTSETALEDGIAAFRDARCGVDDEEAALDYALYNLPEIDRGRIYAVGHSSGGSIALLAAAHDPRIAGCVAFAPACDIVRRVGENTIRSVAWDLPDFRAHLRRCSPLVFAGAVTCPVFLFHADDDYVVPTSDVSAFADTLRLTNPHVTYLQVPTGGHVTSMLTTGIPAALKWLAAQRAKDLPAPAVNDRTGS